MEQKHLLFRGILIFFLEITETLSGNIVNKLLI